MPFKHLAHNFVYAETGAVKLPGVGGLAQGCCAPCAIALVAFTQFLQKGMDVSIDSFFFQLLMPALCTRLGARREEYLEHRVRKYHRPHVAAVCDQSRGFAKRPLAREQRGADQRQSSHPRGPFAAVLAPDGIGNTLAKKKNFSAFETYIEATRAPGERRLIVEAGCLFDRRQRHQPVQGTAIQIVMAQFP